MTEETSIDVEDRQDTIRARARAIALGSPDGFIAFGFGSGLLTRAPGTMGTLAAVPFAWWVQSLGGMTLAIFLLSTFVLGSWLCQRVATRLGVEDYGGIVWDEMVGYWVAVAWLPGPWYWLVAAFILFRFFDIIKPWPISALDENFEGGFGIMLDDIVAGIYTAVLLAGAEVVLTGG